MKKKLIAFKKLLAEYLAFRSISTDEAFQPQIVAVVEWLKNLFTVKGFVVQILQGPTTNPVILASYVHSPTAKTVLIYGHYDVQPADIKDGWINEPFELYEKDGRIYARGVVDNKGQNLIHAFTIFNLMSEGKLKYNVKFMLEGNEETGNPDMTALVAQYAEELSADEIIVSDGQILGSSPTIEASMRGAGNLMVSLRTAKDSQHSGLYGGAIPSATDELIRFLGKLKDEAGIVSIPGFYDDMDEIPESVVTANIAMDKLKLAENLKTTGVKKLLGAHDFYTQIGLYPTIEFTGISGGYYGPGFKNIIPEQASARINFRIVASQNIDTIIDSFKAYAAEIIPDYVTVEITGGAICPPVKVSTDSAMCMEIMMLQKVIYGEETMITACGASIPIVKDFQDILGVDAILVSLGNDDCGMHAANENFLEELIEKGLILSERIFSS